ncbi:MAG: DUF4340 domain-containing protein [Candidatus Omnitrophica bacterium]|nr:DUF4340 domain-containing protein [Candidatus Omnitrophota bacterium]
MKFSTTVVFTALFVVVGGSYFYLKPELGPQLQNKTEALPPASLRLLPAEKNEDITWLQIQNFKRNEVMTLVRDGEEWKLKFPLQAPADPLIAKGLISALRLSPKSRVLVPEKGWEEYGLLQPQIKVGVETSPAPGRRRYLAFGNISPVGGKVFARWEDEKGYFLLSQDLVSAFDRTVYSLRWKQIFRTAPEKISKIFVKTKQIEYEMVRRSGAWFWLQPVEKAGDKVSKKMITEIILQLGQLYMKDFLDDEKGPAAKLGILQGSSAVKVSGDGKEYEVLEIGREVPAKDSFYARREGSKEYFYIARNNIQDFFTKIEEASSVAGPAKKS